MAGGLCRRAKVDRLWRVWYALLVLAVHAFLLHASFQRYSAFRSLALRERWPMGPMNFHLAGGIAAALLLPLFLYAAFLPTGNFAEDGEQVGRDRSSLRVATAEVAAAASGGASTCLSRLRRHFMPYTCALHLLMALCLLLPLPVLEAEEINREQLAKDQVWRTDLDFVIRPSATSTHVVSTEVFNLVLALAVLTVRYPSVFWFSNRVFSMLFSVVLCACGLHTFLAYEATSVLYKAVAANSVESPVANLPPAVVLGLDAFGSLLLLLANAAFFEFGYAQVLTNLRKYRHYLQLEAPSSGSSDRSNGSSSGSSITAPCYVSNAPQLFGVLLMLLAVLCKAPVLWDWVGLYRSRQEPILLAAAVSVGVCLLLWVAAWLALCCRPVWQFNIRLELEFPSKISPDYQHQQPGQPGGSSSTMPLEHRSPQSLSSSDLSKKSNQYVFVQQRGSAEMQPVSMIPTVSEQVDNASESSYTCGGASGTLDRQAGLVKYQVRRNSAQLGASAAASGSLKRNALLARSRSNNRVTFKDRHETIPGSPGSSQNTSSDSGIEASRLPGQQQPTGSAVTSLQISLNDDYARVNKQPRAPSRQSNYEDYPMLGCLFGGQDVSAGASADYYQHHHTDPYGRPLPGVPVPPPPPAGYGATASAMGDPYGVPDILLSRSPFASLSRQSANKPDHFDYYEMQQQQHHLRSGSYPSLPQPMQTGDQIEGLCSQV